MAHDVPSLGIMSNDILHNTQQTELKNNKFWGENEQVHEKYFTAHVRL